MNRRDILKSSLAGTAGLAASMAGGSAAAMPELGRYGKRLVNVIDLGAVPDGVTDSAQAFQKAIDALTSTGGIVYIPAGNYVIGSTLIWANPVNRRVSGILFQGDGQHTSTLNSRVKSGPLLRVRGVPRVGPVSTTFFWGGGIHDLGLRGSGGGADHDAVEILGWWNGSIENCLISGFSRHGIRAITDLALNPNPDFTASTLLVKAVQIERCGGWGFRDDSGNQGAPSWSWDHCLFGLCRLGGAYVQSSSHSFVKCSFSACGWRHESDKPAAAAYGLFFAGTMTVASRQWVEGCEFDTNLTAHIGARFLCCSSFINNRFIFHDRYKAGRLCPLAGVELGTGDARAAIRSVEFRQSFFRFDRGGETTGFLWANTVNVRDIEIINTVFSNSVGGDLHLSRYGGMELSRTASDFGYNIRDRELSGL
ncbi:MAG: glycosyl hydrolase family 28-related protein [Fluviicoccus sp.]|uniref:glycosyl hydrolase family 28-related protein n=1 Tax=Fluviicoccus sp. TaxID=2003552 RepID=UPI00271F025B|nr:glycosyl hydrolase family 28-related protein [Fluviicoccus sp.]MDO8330195.1 glycosyl hydrolase family 28-related protein [Fluviicoccus sp.]